MKHISTDGNNVYIPQNTLIEAMEMQSQKFVFGQWAEVLGLVGGNTRTSSLGFVTGVVLAENDGGDHRRQCWELT